MRTLRTAFVLGMLTVMHTARIHAQDMDVPVAVQLPLFLKVITFDRESGNSARVFGIVYQAQNRESVRAKDEALRVMRGEPGAHAVPVDIDRESLSAVIAQHKLTHLYITPVRAIDVRRVMAETRALGVRTFTGVPSFVDAGVAVGVRLQGQKPKLLVNVAASRAEGANYSAEFLKLAEIIQ